MSEQESGRHDEEQQVDEATRLAAERVVGLNAIDDVDEARFMAEAAEEKMDLALQRESNARQLREQAEAANTAAGPRPGRLEQTSQDIMSGYSRSSWDKAEDLADAAEAQAATAEFHRDEAEVTMRKARRVYRLGALAAQHHPDVAEAAANDQEWLRARHRQRELTTKVTAIQRELPALRAELQGLEGQRLYNPKKIMRRSELRSDVEIDESSLEAYSKELGDIETLLASQTQ